MKCAVMDNEQICCGGIGHNAQECKNATIKVDYRRSCDIISQAISAKSAQQNIGV